MADENAETSLAESAPGSDPAGGHGQGDYDFGDPGNSAFSEGSISEVKSAAAEIKAAAPASPPATPAETPPAGSVPASDTVPAAPAVLPTAPADAAAPSPAAAPAETPASAAVPAAPVAPVAPAPPAPLQLSQAQVSRAQALGLTPEYLQQFKDPETGILTAENIALRAFTAGRGQVPATNQQAAQPAQQPVVAAQTTPPPAFDEAAVRQFWIDQGFDHTVAEAQVQTQRELHASKVVNFQLAQRQQEQVAWQSQAYHEIQRLQNVERQNNEAVRQQAIASAQDTVVREVGAWESGLDASLKPLVTPESRQQILSVAEAINSGLMARGVQPQQLPSINDLCNQAMYAVLGPQIAAVSRTQVREQVASHQAQAIARPSSGGKPPAVTGIPAAVAFAERWAADHKELYQTGPDSRALDDV